MALRDIPAKAWNALGDAASSVGKLGRNTAIRAGEAGVAVGSFTKNAPAKAWNALGEGASSVGRFGRNAGSALADSGVGRFSKRMGAKTLTAGVALAVIGGTAAAVSSIRSSKAKESKRKLDHVSNEVEIPQVMTAADFAAEPAGPAEGYAPGQWGNYVQGGRSGAELQRGNASNPRMSAVPEASIDDMGAIRR